jgi:hypothetical protein
MRLNMSRYMLKYIMCIQKNTKMIYVLNMEETWLMFASCARYGGRQIGVGSESEERVVSVGGAGSWCLVAIRLTTLRLRRQHVSAS